VDEAARPERASNSLASVYQTVSIVQVGNSFDGYESDFEFKHDIIGSSNF